MQPGERLHLIGSIPLATSEKVFRTLAQALGPHLSRMPDGETGERSRWVYFQGVMLRAHPDMEIDPTVPPYSFVQWDGKVIREIPRLRLKGGAKPDPASFKTGYADMAIESWGLFDRMQKAGTIPANVKFQISIPSPIAPTYNNMVPADRPKLIPPLTQHFIGEIEKIAGVKMNRKYDLTAPQGVAGRNSDNTFIQEVLGWEPSTPLSKGLAVTFKWIKEQNEKRKKGMRVGVG